jgi:phosphonate transport system permease protein
MIQNKLYFNKGFIESTFVSSVIIVIIISSFSVTEVKVSEFISGIPHMWNLISEMVPPNFSLWKNYITLTFETIGIGLWGTVIGSFIAFPIGFFAASNTAPHPIVFICAKSIVNTLRAIPELVYALLFVLSFGLGALAGVLTITFCTIALLGKFFSEAVESINMRSIEALEATGSHGINVVRHAVIPQVFPLFVSYNLYILDHNIRVAMAIGIVGAGGLGVELFRQMRTFHYPKVLAILIIMLIVVSLIDRLSSYFRNRIIKGFEDDTINQKFYNRIVIFGLIGISLLFFYFIPISAQEIITGVPNIIQFLKDTFPPDFSKIGLYIKLMLETIAIGVSGTVVAVALSIPLGILASRNLIHSSAVYTISKEIINFFRAVPDLVFALIFVAAVGLGPFAGVLALGLHTTGFLAKMYGETIENIDPGPKEAVEATGASFLQVVKHAIFPQIIPLFNSYNLYILDRNIRSSAVLGIVGAGGIGFELTMSMRLFEYQKTLALIIIVLITIIIVDKVSEYLRRREV